MLDLQGWKFVARDAIALYVLKYFLRFPVQAILGLPEPPSLQAQILVLILGFLFGVASFGVVAFYTRNEVWKHLFAVCGSLYCLSAITNLVGLYTRLPGLDLFLIANVLAFPLINYSITAALGGYLALKLKCRSKSKRAAC